MHLLEEITDIIISVSSKYDVDEIYIFGSYARREADDISDINIAINAPRLTAMQLSSFSYKIEIALNLNVDLIPMETMDDEFLDSIRRDAVKVI